MARVDRDAIRVRLARRLDAILDEQTRTASEIARAIERTPSALSNWRSGTRDVAAVDLALLAPMLGTTADYLLGLTDDPRPRGPAAQAAHRVEVVIVTRNDSIEDARVIDYGPTTGDGKP